MRFRALIVGFTAASLALLSANPAPAAVGYVVKTSVFGGTTMVDRWNPCQRDITFMINLAALPVARRAGAVKDVGAAIAKVAAATGIRFRFAGYTSYQPTGTKWANSTTTGGEPAEIVVTWVDARHPSTLLGTNGEVAGTGGFAVRAMKDAKGWVGYSGRGFVVLSAKVDASLRPGFGAGVTRGELLLHEMGHVMGLGHSSLTSQIMYPVLQNHPVTTYGTYDLAGLRKVGRAAGCFRINTLWQDLS